MNKTAINKTGQIIFYSMAVLIAFLSLISLRIDMSSEIAGFRIDYVYHFLAYTVLSVSLFLWKNGAGLSKRMIFFILLFGVFYSIVFEVIQYFIPERAFNPLDSLSNILGFIFGGIVFLLTKKWISCYF